MKKLLLLLSILTFSFGAFTATGDLCDAGRNADAKDDLVDYSCSKEDAKNGTNGCTKENETVQVQKES